MILGSIAKSGSSCPTDGALSVAHPVHKHLAVPSFKHRSVDESLRSDSEEHATSDPDVRYLAPLSRTWAFLDGIAFIQHALLVRKALGAPPRDDLQTIPLMYQGASDNFLAATDDIPLRAESDGIDLTSEIEIITDTVPLGTSVAQADAHIKPLTLLNDVSLRELIPREVATGFSFLQGKPPSSFAPFVVTPDKLGSGWRNSRVHLPLKTRLNGYFFGSPNAVETHFSFHELIGAAAATRPLRAGAIVDSGTVSSADESVDSSCIVERRML